MCVLAHCLPPHSLEFGMPQSSSTAATPNDTCGCLPDCNALSASSAAGVSGNKYNPVAASPRGYPAHLNAAILDAVVDPMHMQLDPVTHLRHGQKALAPWRVRRAALME